MIKFEKKFFKQEVENFNNELKTNQTLFQNFQKKIRLKKRTRLAPAAMMKRAFLKKYKLKIWGLRIVVMCKVSTSQSLIKLFSYSQ